MAERIPAQASSEPTIPLHEHYQVLRELDERFAVERDRRLTEVAVEREKALKIKETADLAALQLAREIQTYKDEKANELREQINSERGLYATKHDLSGLQEKLEAQLTPVMNFVALQQGRSGGLQSGWAVLVGAIVAAGGITAMIVALVGQ